MKSTTNESSHYHMAATVGQKSTLEKYQHSQILKYGSQKVVSRLKLFRDGSLSILVSILTLYMPVFMILQN